MNLVQTTNLLKWKIIQGAWRSRIVDRLMVMLKRPSIRAGTISTDSREAEPRFRLLNNALVNLILAQYAYDYTVTLFYLTPISNLSTYRVLQNSILESYGALARGDATSVSKCTTYKYR